MKDEYNLLNNVEIDFSEYEVEEVSEFEKKRMMSVFLKNKNKVTFWNKKRALSVAVVVLVAINVGIHNESVLATVDSFKNNINTWLGLDNGVEYSTQIGETSNVKDTKLTLNEFFADTSRIIINIDIDSNYDTDEICHNNEKLVPDIYINDKKVSRSSDYIGYRIGPISENKKENNVILELEIEKLELNDKDNIKLVFSNVAKECGAEDSDFTYSFSYDSSSYKNASKSIKVDKKVIIDENELYLDNVTITPDRVLIDGEVKGFSIWKENKDINYHYDIVDENGEEVPLKAEIGEGAYFYRYDISNDPPHTEKKVKTLKVIPYTFDKIDTNSTSVSYDGRTKYIIEDKIITVNLE